MTGTMSEALEAGDRSEVIRGALVRRRSEPGDRLGELTHYAMAVPGKLLRPLMLVTSAEAVGGGAGNALPAAVAVEHLHVASLVHDDIIDGDELRRGRPSVHARHGVADAIVTGDALLFDLFAAVAECRAPAEVVVAVVGEFARAGVDLCRGQVLESAMTPPGPGAPGSRLADYLEVAALKTGALFRAACRAGALLGSGSAAQAELLGDYGRHTGVAFQMYDDLLPYLGSGESGKPDTSDAANLRPTWPVLIAHRDGGPEHREAVETALSGTLAPAQALESLRFAVLGSGALGTARRLARERSGVAVARLRELPGTEAADRLAGLAEIAVDRDR
ncbi:polyprenyl synthetase family protein [Amycolatopsis sp. PS_44_ISF1]|uniref:polyprenyl synthetase family protein n=1 Tax=Amycolatopsis sp. PS_44_ISF1 TaxID=2974917 RepID=UPI0028DF07A2|nr:polyprenyl synthetase family protein [Amycolatopsis sp. PS_44_ISF1]MDT8913052.1 polyprenyl synthetase family protein [Amycolatopsis sp. PS_44_ISF1]